MTHKTIHLDPETDIESALGALGDAARRLLANGRSVVVTVADEDELLSPQKAAERLGFSRQHVRRLIEAGQLKGGQLANSSYWQIPLKSILEFEERRAAAERRAENFSRSLDEIGVPPE